ncbi:MAG: helix-turn-helix domain-containing protein [Spirochaetaceae bacterium]|nr:helix-turn-helix domain-containing protein [Spirochaetaceae bacterium]
MNEKNLTQTNSRIKELRRVLKITQANFAQTISLSSGYLAGIETNKRRVNDRLIKLICSSFAVSENWLRTGEGEMFAKNNEEQFVKLIGLFKELKPKYQTYIFKEISYFLKMQTDTP